MELLKAKSKDAAGKVLTVKFPKDLNLAAPCSEKMFVGNVLMDHHIPCLPTII